MIKLINNNISNEDNTILSRWLLEKNPKILSMSENVRRFESEWSKWQETKYSVYVNSGSSANLLMLFALHYSKQMRNDKVVVPALSWATTVSPVMQLGLKPILCDASWANLGIDIDKFEAICKAERPAALILVNVLGLPAHLNPIKNICSKYNVILLEDNCESVGSTYNKVKTGNFGLMSTFSYYVGHHMSTIEGGMVCTRNKALYELLLMGRSHGWARDLRHSGFKSINPWMDRYTFWMPGFNLRNTELGAVLGLARLGNLDVECIKRYRNYLKYQQLLNDLFWKPQINKMHFISNFAYPVIHPKRHRIIKALDKIEVENRPLIAGSISKQPFFVKEYGEVKGCEFAEQIHREGMYIPNHSGLTDDNIRLICDTINEAIR